MDNGPGKNDLCVTCSAAFLPSDYDRYWIITSGSGKRSYQHDACRDHEDRRIWRETGLITNNLMMTNMTRTYNRPLHVRDEEDEIRDQISRIESDVKRINVDVWFGGADSTFSTRYEWEHGLSYVRLSDSLQTRVEESDRCLWTKMSDGTVLTCSTGIGRAQLYFELADDQHFSILAAEGEQTAGMGIGSMYTTEQRARDVMNELRRTWRGLEFRKKK